MAESPELEPCQDEADVDASEETTETEAPAAGVVQYLLSNVTRGRNNRTARVAVPGRIPFVQRLAGGRIIVRRARPARISEAVLLANLEEIKRAVARHTIVVTTLAGQVVDLETFGVAAPAAHSPLPNPPLDSAKNDKNEGVGYNVPGSPEGTTLDSEEPELLRQNSLLEVEEGEPAPEAVPDQPTADPVVVSPDAAAAAPEEAPVEEGSTEEEGDEEGEDEGEPEPTPDPSAPPAAAGATSNKKKRRKGRK